MKILLFKVDSCPGGYLNFLLNDCHDVFRGLGHMIEVFDLTRYKDSKEVALRELMALIDRFHPDFAFLTGWDKIILEFLASREIPYGDWVFDDPLLWNLSGFCSPYGYLFIADRVWIERLKIEGINNAFYLPCAVNPRIYREIELTEKDIKKYSCDVSFVGNSKYSYYKRHYLDELQRDNSREFQKVLEDSIKAFIENPLLEISDILEIAQEKYHYFINFRSEIEREFFELGLNFAASSLYRKEVVEKLADLRIRIYGDDGWREWSRDGKIDFRGGIIHREELVKLYNACKINIGATLGQLRTAVTVRPFQVSACGGFLIDDYRHDLGRLFDLGKEMVCYRDKKELRELVEYFLKHPEERREIAQRAKARVLKDHTFKQRMEEAVRILREAFNL